MVVIGEAVVGREGLYKPIDQWMVAYPTYTLWVKTDILYGNINVNNWFIDAYDLYCLSFWSLTKKIAFVGKLWLDMI